MLCKYISNEYVDWLQYTLEKHEEEEVICFLVQKNRRRKEPIRQPANKSELHSFKEAICT